MDTNCASAIYLQHQLQMNDDYYKMKNRVLHPLRALCLSFLLINFGSTKDFLWPVPLRHMSLQFSIPNEFIYFEFFESAEQNSLEICLV